MKLSWTGQIFLSNHIAVKTDRDVDVSTAKVFVSYNVGIATDEDLRGRNVYISICFNCYVIAQTNKQKLPSPTYAVGMSLCQIMKLSSMWHSTPLGPARIALVRH